MTPSPLPRHLPPGRAVPGFLAETIPSLSNLGTSLSSARACPTHWELSTSQVPTWGVGSTATSVTGRHVCIVSECSHPSRPEIGRILHTGESQVKHLQAVGLVQGRRGFRKSQIVTPRGSAGSSLRFTRPGRIAAATQVDRQPRSNRTPFTLTGAGGSRGAGVSSRVGGRSVDVNVGDRCLQTKVCFPRTKGETPRAQALPAGRGSRRGLQGCWLPGARTPGPVRRKSV